MKKKRLLKMLAHHLERIERIHADIAHLRDEAYAARADCERSAERAAEHAKARKKTTQGRDERGRFLRATPTSRAYAIVKNGG